MLGWPRFVPNQIKRQARLPMRRVLVLSVLMGTAASASGQALRLEPAPGTDLRPCIARPAQATQAPPPPQQQVPPRPEPALERKPDGDLRKPIAEREVLDLIAMLEAVTATPEVAQARKSVAPAPDLDRSAADRLRVVLHDVTTLLVTVHAREATKQLETSGPSGSQAREWLQGRFTALQTCATASYEGRGGATAYRQSLALVEKHRSKLEPLVLGLGQWVPSGPPPGSTRPRPDAEPRR